MNLATLLPPVRGSAPQRHRFAHDSAVFDKRICSSARPRAPEARPRGDKGFPRSDVSVTSYGKHGKAASRMRADRAAVGHIDSRKAAYWPKANSGKERAVLSVSEIGAQIRIYNIKKAPLEYVERRLQSATLG